MIRYHTHSGTNPHQSSCLLCPKPLNQGSEKAMGKKLGKCPRVGIGEHLRACLAATLPFRSPIQMILSLPFQNGEKVIFTAEMVAQRNGTVAVKQALNVSPRKVVFLPDLLVFHYSGVLPLPSADFLQGNSVPV